jgi:hypothetical protein
MAHHTWQVKWGGGGPLALDTKIASGTQDGSCLSPGAHANMGGHTLCVGKNADFKCLLGSCSP